VVRRRKSDEELLFGSGRELGVFYERYEPWLLGYFGAATRSAELAADLTAEVFATVLEARAGFDPARGNVRMWLFGIAHNVLAASARRGRVEAQARRRLGLEPLRLEGHELDAIDGLIAREGDARVREWLAMLPPEQAAALQARVLEEREYADIAKELACSEAVIRQRVSRGLRRLREETS
jgi:RNA polymerase sigma-70 factor (ECF subfamily)